MQVGKEEMLKLAKLSRLEFSDEELEKMRASMDDMLDYFQILKQVNLDGVEPMTSVDLVPRPLRPDVIEPMLPKALALANAPETNLEHFSIPKVIGG